MKGNSFFSVKLIPKLALLGLLMGLLPSAASAGIFRSLGRVADKVGNVVVVGPVKGSVRELKKALIPQPKPLYQVDYYNNGVLQTYQTSDAGQALEFYSTMSARGFTVRAPYRVQ